MNLLVSINSVIYYSYLPLDIVPEYLPMYGMYGSFDLDNFMETNFGEIGFSCVQQLASTSSFRYRPKIIRLILIVFH